MKQPKPKVGQIWGRRGVRKTVTSTGHGKADLDGDYLTRISDLLTTWKFIPQNDLEFAAVNLDEWIFGNGRMHVSKEMMITCHNPSRGISERQWQSMRYELGLDDKPHVRASEFANKLNNKEVTK